MGGRIFNNNARDEHEFTMEIVESSSPHVFRNTFYIVLCQLTICTYMYIKNPDRQKTPQKQKQISVGPILFRLSEVSLYIHI